MVANPARGQLNRENEYSHLHTQAESGDNAYIQNNM